MSIAGNMAPGTQDFLYVEMSEMDYLLICHVRELRVQRGLTQLQLSQRMKLADGFVSKVETFAERAKYSIRHLPLLAMALNCSIKDLIPKDLPQFDLVRLTLERTSKMNKDGSLSKKLVTAVIKTEAIEKKLK